jgi:hypothetical protein
MRRFAALLLAVPFVALAVARADDPPADETPPLLEKHPAADAKEGEWIRYRITQGTWKNWFVMRVLGVRAKEGVTEILTEVVQVDEAGTKDIGTQAGSGKWTAVPEFKAQEHQTFKKDEMVWMTLKDKKIACRHLRIEELANPPFPMPKRTREVWYTNEILANGKLKEISSDGSASQTMEALEWGTMTAEEVAKRRKIYESTDAPPPGEKPPGEGEKSCGASEGGEGA